MIRSRTTNEPAAIRALDRTCCCGRGHLPDHRKKQKSNTHRQRRENADLLNAVQGMPAILPDYIAANDTHRDEDARECREIDAVRGQWPHRLQITDDCGLDLLHAIRGWRSNLLRSERSIDFAIRHFAAPFRAGRLKQTAKPFVSPMRLLFHRSHARRSSAGNFLQG